MTPTLIEAPGAVGEARLVARQIRTLLGSGTDAGSIVVTHRDLVSSEAVLTEVFDEYAVPHHWPIPKLLSASRAVVFLLRAWKLPQTQFRFTALAAVLRNGYFQPPAWDAQQPLMAESLLRQLGVPREKRDYLATINDRIQFPKPAMEDEHAEVRQQQRYREQLAVSRPFIEWFFARWDDIPATATAAEHVARLTAFINDLGLAAVPDIRTLKAALDTWAESFTGRLRLADFEAELKTVLDVTECPAEPNTNAPTATRTSKPTLFDQLDQSTGVRLLAVESAAEATCEHLFVMGLGEGSFPRVTADQTLETEQELWTRLIRMPSESLTLSYSAVDPRGQALLPSTFLAEYVTTHLVTRIRQLMLIESYAQETAYSEAEMRVQYAAAELKGPPPNLKPDLLANLHAVQMMTEARFRGGKHDVYDGVLRNEPLIRGVAAKFQDKTFSPTALERYVGCPFRFWMQDVLRLEAPTMPSEEVEATQRGTVIHRALSRYHADDTATKLDDELTKAVAEDIDRTPSPVMKEIWHLERRRIKRSLDRYDGYWAAFQNDCREALNVQPKPQLLEAHVGVRDYLGTIPFPPLTIELDGVTVKIGGVIDRVDTAALHDGTGYWVIDYKTGSGASYTGAALKNFEKLQLPLYALAVETILPGSRPLGLAYWLISDGGVKPVLPDRRSLAVWLEKPEAWQAYRDTLKEWVVTLAMNLRRGDFRLAPRHKSVCEFCPYSGVCRINQMRDRHATALPLPMI
ncbi:hypothetical protein BH11PLA2_BH11PLA2_11470 [soil metagenome]